MITARERALVAERIRCEFPEISESGTARHKHRCRTEKVRLDQSGGFNRVGAVPGKLRRRQSQSERRWSMYSSASGSLPPSLVRVRPPLYNLRYGCGKQISVNASLVKQRSTDLFCLFCAFLRQLFQGTKRTQKYPKSKRVIIAMPGIITIHSRRGSKRATSPMKTGNASSRCRGNDK